MVFSSIVFLFYFLPIFLIVYFFTPKKLKNSVLFLSGLIFYSWGEPVNVIYMLLCILVNYGAGRLMERADHNEKRRRLIMILSVVFSLGLLGVFKYSGFFAGIFGLDFKGPALPIGISFYTFQSMSYCIDLYRRQIHVQKSIVDFGAYVTMFPQLIAGPIVRYADVERELNQRSVNLPAIGEGVGTFICGLAKKVILANSIGMLWTEIKAHDLGQLSACTAWIGILAYTFQIYFDFSGYSDMAIGLGKMLGFHFPKNFDHPYQATSITDFWRRWHITLSTWFREYVYIPLGGNRVSKWKWVRNLMIVWSLTGFWHGASWNFIFWGLYFGILLTIEKLWLGKYIKKLPKVLAWLYTFFCVVISWVMFDLSTVSQITTFIGSMFGGSGVLVDDYARYQFRTYGLIFLLCILCATSFGKWLLDRVRRSRRMDQVCCVVTPVLQMGLFALCIAYLVNETYNPFLYFRF
ncbi:MBOAT family O-acyltransferase [Ruminococcus sp.]|uniref:MBOAT family O-acyltransferase n=1 Tax=Ruminococcus sp. TaxID=41978 RepID=UPI0025CC8093|nr:MBOAT family O-acyltransferase [Ruminococcus sp.]MCI5816939.1 MBOAT family protein [Ruminococcus sp.]